MGQNATLVKSNHASLEKFQFVEGKKSKSYAVLSFSGTVGEFREWLKTLTAAPSTNN